MIRHAISAAALCAGAVLWAPTPAPAASVPAPSIQRLADIEEIRTLLLNYGRLLDDRKLADYSQLFARDGEWIGGFGGARGPANILAMMQKAFVSLPNDPSSRNYHILTNILVDVKGDKASAWSRWTFMVPSADKKPVAMVAGRYEDELIREDGRWKFLRRVVIADIPYQDPREAQAKPATP